MVFIGMFVYGDFIVVGMYWWTFNIVHEWGAVVRFSGPQHYNIFPEFGRYLVTVWNGERKD